MEDESTWEVARLIPVSGITGPDEQERRGSSAFLAVLRSVKEFGRSLTTSFGAPAGAITTFIEVPFELGDRKVRPDGVIRVVRGNNTWTALVEVKTSRNDLQRAQLEDYLEIARIHDYQAVLTISNQIPTIAGEPPTLVDKKKTKKVALIHRSWSWVHTQAVMEGMNHEVNNPDQARLLTEYIRYLEHPRSGAVDFDDMGPAWVSVRNSVTNRTLRATEKASADVVASFAQLMAFAAMKLSRRLGVPVQSGFPKPASKVVDNDVAQGVKRLVDSGTLEGYLRVPNSAGGFSVLADLRAGRVRCSITVDAPREGKSTTRVNWLIRQLAKAPETVEIEAWSAWAHTPGPCRRLAEVRGKPELLLDDPKKELKSLTVRRSVPAGTKRGQGKGSFVGSVLDLVESFYEDVVLHIKPWTPPVPPVKGHVQAADPAIGEDGVAGELPVRSITGAVGSEVGRTENGTGAQLAPAEVSSQAEASDLGPPPDA